MRENGAEGGEDLSYILWVVGYVLITAVVLCFLLVMSAENKQELSERFGGSLVIAFLWPVSVPVLAAVAAASWIIVKRAVKRKERNIEDDIELLKKISFQE